jgi:vacuolar-type H+-ATPase subunit H
MATQDPGAREDAGSLTALPRVEELQKSDSGFDEAQVTQAFDSFRRHITQLQTQLRVLQAAGRGGDAQPTGHAVRMDALHLVRGAAEFADALEKDAQEAAARQIRRAETEISDKQREFHKTELQVEKQRADAETKRNELLGEARKEASDMVAKADRDSKAQLKEAEARGDRLLEQARHQATELTNSARAEVDQSLEWARVQATEIIRRAQTGAEQLLGAAGLGGAALDRVVKTIVGENESPPGSSSDKPSATTKSSPTTSSDSDTK